MKSSCRVILVALCGVLTVYSAAQSNEEIPIQRCDVLPYVVVKVAGKDMHLLLDTAATSILKVKSFSSGVSKEIHVSSWSGMAATSAREVSIPEILLGKHKLQILKLPAIDLSPIGKACGGQIDGILGVDLLDKIGLTIDLQRRVAMLKGVDATVRDQFNDMEKSMERCTDAFNLGHADELIDCLDPEIVFYTPEGEFSGRQQVMEYLQRTFLKFAPNLHYQREIHDVRSFGDALWYSYDYTLEMPRRGVAGHGMAMCRPAERTVAHAEHAQFAQRAGRRNGSEAVIAGPANSDTEFEHFPSKAEQDHPPICHDLKRMSQNENRSSQVPGNADSSRTVFYPISSPNHHKLLDSNANFEEFEVTSTDKKLHIKEQTLRLYNSATRQWSIYPVNLDNGTLDTPPVVGGFTGKLGEFYHQENFKGRTILVSHLWLNISPNSARMEQSFSHDGGKTWEVNWICELSR